MVWRAVVVGGDVDSSTERAAVGWEGARVCVEGEVEVVEGGWSEGLVKLGNAVGLGDDGGGGGGG